MSDLNLIAISVGNTRTAVGLFSEGSLSRSVRIANEDAPALVSAIVDAWDEIRGSEGAAAVLATVNDPFATTLEAALDDTLDTEILRVGEDIPIPISTRLDPETLTGIDRLLNAAAAWDQLRSACVIVDAGTAVTVDFVDGQGTFQGGAIAPGVSLQLRALHERTASLPAIDFAAPDAEAFGKNTRQAMLQGVFYGVRGLVWRLVERYSEQYGAFPPVIATGGDATALFTGDELVDRIVPDLTLHGIAAAVRAAGLAAETDEE